MIFFYRELPSTVLAQASPYFTQFNNGSCRSTKQNVLLQQLTTGKSNLSSLSSARARLTINSLLIDDFFLALSKTDICPPDKFDLYSVLLHEIGHLLGFAGGGNNIDINYYDTHLQLNNTPVADNNCGNCYTKIDRDILSTALQNNPCNVTINSIPVSDPGNEDITNDNVYANAVSHLSTTCPNGSSSFVMNPTFNLGESKRTFTTIEKNIFCNLGLEFIGCQSTRTFIHYEELSDDILTKEGIFDCCTKIESTCGGEMITLLNEDLLCNDYGDNLLITFASVSSSNGTVSLIDGNIEYTPAPDFYDDASIRYYVHNESTCETMISRVTVNVAYCPECFSNDDCYGVLCVDSFDDLPDYTEINGSTSKYGIAEIYFDHEYDLPNQSPLGQTPDFCFNDNNNFIYFDDIGNAGPESFGLPLEYPIHPGENVSIELEFTGNVENTGIDIYGSQQLICNPIEQLIPLEFCGETIDCGGRVFEPICIAYGIFNVTSPINIDGTRRCDILTSEFETQSFIWTNKSSSTINYVYFEPRKGGRLAISDINISKIPNFVVERVSCSSYNFSYPNLSNQDQVASWNIESGPVIYDSNDFTYNFAIEGTFEVCLTINCSNNEFQVCQSIEVGGPWDENQNNVPIACELCQNPETAVVNARRCDDTSNSFFVDNFDIQVPKGYGPCRENDFYAESSNGTIITNNYSIDESNSAFDIISMSFDFIADNPNNAMRGLISLCSADGLSSQCIAFTIDNPQTCESCNEITLGSASDAICDDSNPYDDVSEYSGTINLPISFFDDFCGLSSAWSGISFEEPYLNSNQTISIDYHIAVDSDSDLVGGINILACFDIASQDNCYSFTINVPAPCLKPLSCGALYTINASCAGSMNDESFFNINVNVANLPTQGSSFELCNDLIFEDGSSSSNTLSLVDAANGITNFYLRGDISLSLDCELIQGGTYTTDITVPLCDGMGNEDCITLRVLLTCDACPRIQDPKPRNLIYDIDERVSYYPNPASSYVTIDIDGFSPENEYLVELNDRLGRKVLTKKTNQNVSDIDISSIANGIHFIKILKNGKLLDAQKLVIIK